MAQLHDLTALEQALAVRRGEVSPVELAEHYLDRISSGSVRLGAFVTVTADAALIAAKAAERLVAQRADLPPLHGVPIAIKDLNLTAGVRTSLGSRIYQEFVPAIDDDVVTRLAAAGTVSLGKTNTPEFGLPCYTEPDVAPPARTPWDLDRSAGGSSGGAAAAVAGGLLPFAQGSDGGGSIRIPASVCGLVGVKVSRGRVSNGPLSGDVNGLASNGPLARTVADAAALLDAMAGPMPGDPYWAPPLAAGETFLGHARRAPGRLRIGRYRRPVLADAEVHPDCVAAYESASRLLADLGHEVVDTDPPFGPQLVPVFEVVWAVGAAGIPVDPPRERELRPLTRWLRERGRATTGPAFAAALTEMRQAARRAIEQSAGFDAVLTPTLAQPPARVGGLRDDDDPAADFEAQKRFTPFTATYNVTGQPAISLPLHWTTGGLPIGVQLVGRPADEATLFSLAAQLEAASPWLDRRPAGW
ncbi:MAG TPA: amidase [Mycobacteriales bacterium]|nr:amidase [Mycobacteriales bacterium]